MSKQSLAVSFVLSILLVLGVALGGSSSTASAAPTARPVAAAVLSEQAVQAGAEALLSAEPKAAVVNCGAISCRFDSECGYPDVCGQCKRRAGQLRGTCAPTP